MILHLNTATGDIYEYGNEAKAPVLPPSGWIVLFDVPNGKTAKEQYAEWCAANLPPAPEVEEYTGPKSVRNAQFRVACIDFNIFPEQIYALINSIPDPKSRAKALAWYDFAGDIERDSVYVSAFAQTLGVPESTVNQIFILAETLQT